MVDPAEMTALLRANVFTLKPEALNLATENLLPVWGVMVEFGHPEVVTSLVTLADGSVSVYLSNGSGVIGCGLHPDVRAAARKMLNIAQDTERYCVPMHSFPAPTHGSVAIYLLTREGVLGAEVARHDLDEGFIELAELYYAAHGVIDVVELLGAGVDLVDEMRLTRAQLDSPVVGDTLETQIAKREIPMRGRACQILPYVGNVARRSNS